MSRYKNLDELIDANINGKACMFADSKKYFISDAMVGFIGWYLYMYGKDNDFDRIILYCFNFSHIIFIQTKKLTAS